MIGAHIEFILIVTGALTAVAVLQIVAPLPMLRLIYGDAPKDEASLFLARHWGHFPGWRVANLRGVSSCLTRFGHALAAIEKIALGLGVLRKHPMLATIAAGDSLIAVVYVLYLAGF
jgi:hypothetical protein